MELLFFIGLIAFPPLFWWCPLCPPLQCSTPVFLKCPISPGLRTPPNHVRFFPWIKRGLTLNQVPLHGFLSILLSLTVSPFQFFFWPLPPRSPVPTIPPLWASFSFFFPFFGSPGRVRTSYFMNVLPAFLFFCFFFLLAPLER